MKKQNILILLLLLSWEFSTAQSNFGPKITAIAQNSATVVDSWNVNGNPALLSDHLAPALSLNYLKYLVDTELSAQAIGLILPFKRQTFGLYLQRYGISPYNEIKVSTMAAKNFGKLLSLAIRINYHQIKITNYGTTIGFSADFGAKYQLNTEIIIGFYFNNLSAQQYTSKLLKTTIPVIAYFGLSYLASDKITVAGIIHKELGFAMDVGLGIDYKLTDFMSLRTGVTLKPFKHYGGVGFSVKKLTIDIAVEHNPFLAYTPQIGISYAF